jgi:hypothetical protein
LTRKRREENEGRANVLIKRDREEKGAVPLE